MDIADMAPDFTLPRNGGGTVTLSALRPKVVVLYFYPKDGTAGCTTEALDFTQALPEFAAHDAVILGISKDKVARHDRFAAKHDLGVTLLSDAETDVCERYGVWAEKAMYGRTYMGIVRSTFIIDANGLIAHQWSKVRVKGHVRDVLNAVASL